MTGRNPSFGERLSEIMRLRGMDDAALGEKSGVARQQIQKWRTHKTDPRLSSIIKLCEGLDCTLGAFFVPHLDDGDIYHLVYEMASRGLVSKP